MRSRLFAVALLLSSCTIGVDSGPSSSGDDDSPPSSAPAGTAGAGLGSDTGDSGGEGANIYARVCATGTTTKGIDVSYYQGSINWTSVKNAGYQFTFVRVSDGTGFHDPKFATYWPAAKSAGLIRGAYQFFRPAQNVTAQADLLIAALGGVYTPGDLPPVIDVEDAGGESAATVASKIRQWVDYVKLHLGVDPIVYTGKYFWRDQVGGPTTFVNNALWIAQYTSLCPDLPAPWTKWTFWQNSETGSVSGISGQMDTNFFNGSLADLQAFANSSGSTTMPPPPSTCSSATLDKDVDEGTCVQSASDAAWYQCSSGMWVARSSASSCTQSFAWCASATLGASEPPRTCVQAASDHVWYQCDGTTWASPVSTSTGMGPAGACSSEHSLP
ncbi:MAG TPA: GH25 family lysozyme [Kofleriaceae bacterium]